MATNNKKEEPALQTVGRNLALGKAPGGDTALQTVGRNLALGISPKDASINRKVQGGQPTMLDNIKKPSIMDLYNEMKAKRDTTEVPNFAPVETADDRAARIMKQFEPAFEAAREQTAEEVAGAEAVTTQQTGPNVSSLSMNFINSVRKRGEKRIADLRREMNLAIENADFQAAEQYRQAQIDEFNAQRQLDQQMLNQFSTIVGLQQGERRLGFEGERVDLEGRRINQQARQFQQTFGLQRDQFESDRTFKQAQQEMAQQELEESIRQFGVQTAINMARQNGVEITIDEEGKPIITDIPNIDRRLQEAQINRIQTLLPLEVNKMAADAARTIALARRANKKAEDGIKGALNEAANFIIDQENVLGRGVESESYWNLVKEMSTDLGISSNDVDNMLIRTIQAKKGELNRLGGAPSSAVEDDNIASDFVTGGSTAAGAGVGLRNLLTNIPGQYQQAKETAQLGTADFISGLFRGEELSDEEEERFKDFIKNY